MSSVSAILFFSFPDCKQSQLTTKGWNSMIINKNVREGDLIAFTSNSFLGNMVRLFTKSEYSHVGVVMFRDNIPYLVEAVRPVVRMTPLSHREPYYHIPMGIDKVSDEARKLLYSRIGEKYSIIQAVLAKFNIFINDNSWYCTEVTHEFYLTQGFDIPKLLLPTDFVREVLKIVSASYYVQREDITKEYL